MRKTRTAKTTVLLILVGLLVLSIFTGCASVSPTASPTATPKPIEKLSFKATSVSFGEDPTGKTAQDLWIKKCGELMGKELDITFEFINMQDYGEKFKIMLAGGSLPDVISDWGLTQEELVKYGENGVFVDLSKYMDKMPNYKKYLDMAPSSKPKLYSKDGGLYGLYLVVKNALAVDGGHDINYATGIRQDLFDKNGIATPTTIEELYQAAKKLKALDTKKYPMFQMEEWQNPINLLYAANRVAEGKFYDGTKFSYGPLQEGYKDALIEMNRWYTEGLISPDYFTQTSANGNATMAAGEGMIIPAMWYGYPGYWEAQYPDQKWTMLIGLKNPKYGEPFVFSTYGTDETTIYPNWCVVINAKSAVKDDMVKFLDVQCDDAVCDILQFGIEGVTYTKAADGTKTYIAEAIKNDLLTKNGVQQGACRSGMFPAMQNGLANAQLAPVQNNFVNGKVVRTQPSNIKKDYFNEAQFVPESTVKFTPLTQDETDLYASIMTPIETYAKEQAAKFIMGKRPFSEWDAFITELNNMGDIPKAMDLYTSKIIK